MPVKNPSVGWRRFAAAALTIVAAWSAQAGEWIISDVPGAPGETVHVPVHFRVDGQVIASTATIFLHQPLSVLPQSAIGGGSGSCVANRYNQVEAFVDTRGQAAGTVIHVCSFPVTVPRYFGTQLPMTVRVDECIDARAQPVVCSAGSGARFTIVAEPRWFERAAVIVPRSVPRGPTQQSLLDFDYANDAATPPLASLDVPRPAAVDTIFAPGDWSFGKASGMPNAAVAALLRAVRPTWATRADHAAGVAAARRDPQVESVIEHPGIFPYRVYPAQPRAGQPFALWMAHDACTVLIPTSYDDRVVRVERSTVHVFVPELATMCAVPPGGEYHTLLNMPALPAGEYTLYVTRYETTPELEPSFDAPLQFVVAPGLVAQPPVRVPTLGASALLLLFAVLLFSVRTLRRP